MYVTHFNLLRLRIPQVVLINHRTMNLQFANRVDLATSVQERDGLEKRPKIPIFVIENRVY